MAGESNDGQDGKGSVSKTVSVHIEVPVPRKDPDGNDKKTLTLDVTDLKALTTDELSDLLNTIGKRGVGHIILNAPFKKRPHQAAS